VKRCLKADEAGELEDDEEGNADTGERGKLRLERHFEGDKGCSAKDASKYWSDELEYSHIRAQSLL